MRRGKLGFWLRLAILVLEPALTVLTRRDWRGTEHIPPRGGVVLCPNHVSHADPLALAHYVYAAGRIPRFLAKASLFRTPFVGRVLRGAAQIPVERNTDRAGTAFAAAVDAVAHGEAVIIYPDATLTRDPGLWPMVGRTGAARVGLATGAPVIPVAQWGPQELLPPYGRRPSLLPRKRMRILAGPPVDLSDLAGRQLSAEVLTEATDRIVGAITALLVQLRGEDPPAVRFDPRAGIPPADGGAVGPAREEPA